jgi:hypothetical protein
LAVTINRPFVQGFTRDDEEAAAGTEAGIAAGTAVESMNIAAVIVNVLISFLIAL